MLLVDVIDIIAGRSLEKCLEQGPQTFAEDFLEKISMPISTSTKNRCSLI